MMDGAGRFKAASRSPRRTAVGDPVRTAGCSLSVYDSCHLSGRIVIESMSLFGPNADNPDLSCDLEERRDSAARPFRPAMANPPPRGLIGKNRFSLVERLGFRV